MSLVQNFTTTTSLPNQVDLNWTQPLQFNTVNSEIIVTRTTSHFPMELFNNSFPTKATDPIPVEIFRGQTITGATTTPPSANILTDSLAVFPTSPPLNRRVVRDSTGSLFKIISNTTTTLTLNSTPAAGVYVVLADFPSAIVPQQNFEQDIRTVSAPGSISNLVQFINSSLSVVQFEPESLVNFIFKDANNTRFIVKSNSNTTLTLYGTATPQIGIGMALLSNSANNVLIPYLDNFETDIEATARTGTGLLDDKFYYYTAFTKVIGTNVAQAEYSSYTSKQSTQSTTISTKDEKFGDLLYNYWPQVVRSMDSTGDLEDLMQVFGSQFQELHSLINTYNLQDADNVFVSALVALADQTALPSVGYGIGIDTLRRISRDMLTAWKLKGSKQGIALFVRILTTWDITGGTGLIADNIIDFTPNIEAFRFFSASLGSTNTRFTQTNVTGSTDSFGNTSLLTSPAIPGGRFARSLPGIIIPGFFTFREYVVNLPNVALYIGNTTNFSTGAGTTTITDSSASFGAIDSLVGNFMLPNEGEVNDLFIIVANTSTTITIKGVVNTKELGSKYAVLSPLNTSRFIILTKYMPIYQPFGTFAAFSFL